MACRLILSLSIDYLAATNHRAGRIRYVQEKDNFDSDYLFYPSESLASECQQGIVFVQGFSTG
jgi:hypothetical protein